MDRASHDLLQHAQRFLLNGFPARGWKIKNACNGRGLQLDIAQGSNISSLLFGCSILILTNKGNILQRGAELLNLTAGNGRVRCSINRRDGILCRRTHLFRAHFADVIKRFRRLKITRRNIDWLKGNGRCLDYIWQDQRPVGYDADNGEQDDLKQADASWQVTNARG